MIFFLVVRMHEEFFDVLDLVIQTCPETAIDVATSALVHHKSAKPRFEPSDCLVFRGQVSSIFPALLFIVVSGSLHTDEDLRFALRRLRLLLQLLRLLLRFWLFLLFACLTFGIIHSSASERLDHALQLPKPVQ